MTSGPGRDSVKSSDEVIELLVAGDTKRALLLAAPLTKQEPLHPVHWFLLGAALGERGALETAVTALGFSVERAIAAGNLPMAIAACAALSKLGGDPAPKNSEIAQTFAKGSSLLGSRSERPPAWPTDRVEIAALPDDVTSAGIEEVVQSAMRGALDLPMATRVPPHPLFSNLKEPSLSRLIEAFEVSLLPGGRVVIAEGEPGEKAFVLARGELEVVREDANKRQVLARLGNGALFGEMALLSRAPRAASVVVLRPSVVLSASRSALEALAEVDAEVATELARFCRQRMIDNLLRTSSMLTKVQVADRRKLIEQFETKTYEPGDTLIAQGQGSEGLYLIASGEVSVVHRQNQEETVLATLGPGEVVGEVALVLRRPATAQVVAVHPTVALHLPRDRFLGVIREHPQILAELYDLAVRRDEETSSVVAEQANDADDCILL